ncbi:MAG: phage portal protein [Bacillota bacterium]|nr:phage portal protein [Bacillota bacterium]
MFRTTNITNAINQSILDLRESDQERFRRYQLNWLYYKGRQYTAQLGKDYTKEQKLFKYMRRVFDCVTHTVDTDARFAMGRKLSVEAEEEFEIDILDMWERSNFQAEKYKLARYGANLGDAFLILQNLGDGNAIIPRLVVANSEDMTVAKDPDDQNQILWAKQSYIYFDDRGKSHTRDWIYWPDRIERYTDGKMGKDYPQPHPFGEVPVVHIKPLDIGEAYGLCTWHNVQTQIDEVNELGSFSNRILLRYADPTLVAKGMQPGTKPTIRKGLNEDNVYYLPSPESNIEILEYSGVVLPHILEHIKHIEDNIRDQLPEMSLAKIREQSGLSGYAVSLHAAELIAKIDELRGNFSNGIEWINALALRAMRRSGAPLEEFVNRIVYEPVLPEDEVQTMNVWQMESNLGLAGRKEFWRRQGLSEQEMVDREAEIDDDLDKQLDRTHSQRSMFDMGELERQLLGEEFAGDSTEVEGD